MTKREDLKGLNIVVSKVEEYEIKIEIIYNGTVLPYGSRLIPADLNNLIRYLSIENSQYKNIYSYLVRTFKPYDLYFEINSNLIKLATNKKSNLINKKIFELRNNQVYVYNAVISGKKLLTDFVIIDKLAINPDTGEVVFINNESKSEIKIKDNFEKTEKESNINIIPIAEFNQQAILIRKVELADINFQLNNQIVQPVYLTPKPIINLTNFKNVWQIRLLRDVNNEYLNLSTEIFELLNLQNPKFEKFFLNYKDFRQDLFKAIIEILNEDEDAKIELIVKNFIRKYNHNKHDTIILLRFFDNLTDYFNEPKIQLYLKDQQWYFLEIDVKKDLKILTLPFYICGMEIIDYFSLQTQYSLPKEVFFHKLAELENFYQQNQIKIIYKNKPLKRVDFKVNLNIKKDKINWFEIDSTVFMGNQKLAEENWQRIIANNGFLEIDGEVKFFNQSEVEKLSLLKKYIKNLADKTQIERKLNLFKWLDLKKQGFQVKLDPEVKKIVVNLTNFTSINEFVLPQNFVGNLREYQKHGYYWMGFLYENGLGGILADDMGLGKTIQTIAFILGVKERIIKGTDSTLPDLIVVPPSLVFNWKMEFENFAPKLKVLEYVGVNREMKFQGLDVIITTYELIRREIEKFMKLKFNIIVFDEAQLIKNLLADRSKAVRKLNSVYKLCLTGTPIENNLLEYYAIMDLALPGIYDSLPSFKNLIKENQYDEILKKAKAFILRRTKANILKELPTKVETNQFLELNNLQKEVYQNLLDKIHNIIDMAYNQQSVQQSHFIALTAILRLRQLCISPALINKEFNPQSPKIEFLISKLVELKKENNKALVFSQFTKALDILEPFLNASHINFLRLDGSVPQKERKNLIRQFREDPKQQVFIMSLKAGGLGLNLTSASYIFNLDPWWNPAMENQATARAHRIGQKQKVFVTKLIMLNTIEEKIMQLKEQKEQLFNLIIDQQGIYHEQKITLTKEDFEYLLH